VIPFPRLKMWHAFLFHVRAYGESIKTVRT
jgi:hypothetical protein